MSSLLWTSTLFTKVPVPKCQPYVYPVHAKYILLRKAQVHCPDLSHHHCQGTSLVIQVLSINSKSPNPEERLKMCRLVLLKLKFMSSLKILHPKFGVWIFWFQRICWASFPANDLRFINEKHRSCGLEFIGNSLSVSLSQVPHSYILSLWPQGDTGRSVVQEVAIPAVHMDMSIFSSIFSQLFKLLNFSHLIIHQFIQHLFILLTVY